MTETRHTTAESSTRIPRRSLLRGTAVLGAAGVALRAGAGSAVAAPSAIPRAPSPGAVPTAQGGGIQLFGDSMLNFQSLYALGSTGYGSAEIGEVSAAVDAINAAGPGIASYSTGFQAAGDRVAKAARDARDAGRDVTARARFLRAAEYYAQALFFVLGTEDPGSEPDLFATMRTNWEAAGKLFDPVIQKVHIPYEGTTMPGYFLRPDRSPRRRPTLIANNGSDGQSIEIYPFGPAAAVERGWNALILEGPGQGAMLFDREIVFRPDWEKVITPVVDYLLDREDVDGDRIALSGWSMAGELVVRAAAFERRLAAVVSDPGSVDTFRAWKSLDQVVNAGDATAVNAVWNNEIVPALSPEQQFVLKKRMEIFSKEALRQARAGKMPTDFAAVAEVAKQLRVSDKVIHRVRAPMLVLDYEFEEFYTGQATELFDKLRGPKDLVQLTSAQGAQYHCAPMAPQWRNEVVFDWLEDTLDIR